MQQGKKDRKRKHCMKNLKGKDHLWPLLYRGQQKRKMNFLSLQPSISALELN